MCHRHTFSTFALMMPLTAYYRSMIPNPFSLGASKDIMVFRSTQCGHSNDRWGHVPRAADIQHGCPPQRVQERHAGFQQGGAQSVPAVWQMQLQGRTESHEASWVSLWYFRFSTVNVGCRRTPPAINYSFTTYNPNNKTKLNTIDT